MREGHAVAAHFGSAATELAVCVKRVGLAVRSDLDALEIAGARAVARALPRGRRSAAGRPAPGEAVRTAGSWCCRVAPDRAIVIGPWSAAARWAGIVRHAVVTGAAVDCTDRSDSATALTLVGPRAARLLDDAGLEPDLDCGRCARELVRRLPRRWCCARPAIASCSCSTPSTRSTPGRSSSTSGRALGLSMVGAEALERLAAAPGRIF